MTTCDSNIHRSEYGPLALGDLAATREKGIASTRQVLSDWVVRWDLVCPAQPRHNDRLALCWQLFEGKKKTTFSGEFLRWAVTELILRGRQLKNISGAAHCLPRSTCTDDLAWYHFLCCRKMGASAIEMQKQHHWNDYFPRWLLLEMNDYYLTFHHFRLFHFSSSIFKVVARRHDGSQAMETVGRSRKQENLADRRVGFQYKSANVS